MFAELEVETVSSVWLNTIFLFKTGGFQEAAMSWLITVRIWQDPWVRAGTKKHTSHH